MSTVLPDESLLLLESGVFLGAASAEGSGTAAAVNWRIDWWICLERTDRVALREAVEWSGRWSRGAECSVRSSLRADLLSRSPPVLEDVALISDSMMGRV